MKDNNNKFRKGDLVKLNPPFDPAIGIILEAHQRGDDQVWMFPAYVDILWTSGERERVPIGGMTWTTTELLSRA